MTASKTCTKCKETKLVTAFGKNKRTADGLSYQCRQCKGAYAATPAVRQRVQARRNADRETYRRQGREAQARRRAKYPDRIREEKMLRRARKAGAETGNYSRTEIFARWGGKCAYVCDSPAVHLDHVTALAAGGSDTEVNLLPACAHHNLTKGAKSLATWALEPF